MNEPINFWRTWPLKERITLFFSSFLLFILVLTLGYSYFLGLDNILHWNVVSEINEKLITSNFSTDGKLLFSSTSPIWYIKEHFSPSSITLNHWAYYVLLLAGIFGSSLFLIGISRLQGKWFLLGTTWLAGFLICLRLENAFLSSTQWAFLLSFLAVGLIYYFSNLLHLRFSTYRLLLIWLATWTVLYLLFLKFSQINQPTLSLATYGLIFSVIISLVFIFLIGHEILSSLVWLVSKNSQKGKSSLLPLLVISLIYLSNLLLIYFENSKTISSSTYILHPTALYIASMILGIWGFKKIVDQQGWFSFPRVGVWIYLGMGLIATATLNMAYATGNDPLTELLEDAIAIIHLSVSLTFFVYIIINYWQIFKQGLDVQKVQYKSPYSRLILSRVAAIFIAILLFSFKNFYSYNQFQAGYQNAIGDFYWAEGDLKMAETFYKSGTNYQLYNHRSNISLASLALSQNDKINAAFFFKQATEKSPSEFAFAGLAESLEKENMYFDALFTLQEGNKTFSKSPYLLTNIARLYDRSKMTDSVLYYLHEAEISCSECKVENTNLLAFWIENAKSDKLEEISEKVAIQNYKSFDANKSAIDKTLGKKGILKEFKYDDNYSLDVSNAALLLNNLSNPLVTNESGIEAAQLKKWQELNEPFFEELSWLYAHQQYFRQNKIDGLKQMTIIANANLKNKNLNNQTLGLWLLKEGSFTQGLQRLQLAGDSASVAILQQPYYKQNYEAELQTLSSQILKDGISLKNYESLVAKAPLNPYLLEKVGEFLSKNKNELAAYNLALDATELNPDAPKIWKMYVKYAAKLSQYEYAEDGLMKLKNLVTDTEYLFVKSEYEKQKKEAQSLEF